MHEHIDLTKLLRICLEAGHEILKVYEQDFDVETKADDSPLTIADQKAHAVIAEGLQSAYESIPVLSEEGRAIPYQERKDWQAFWLVDPLDGTKEFIKKNGEFTVNIALIEGQYPTLGVIYAPVIDTFYFGRQGTGAYKLEQASTAKVEDESELLNKSIQLPEVQGEETVRVVASRSHMSEETEAFIEKKKAEHERIEVISAGSSLKFCLVAEGKAAYYPRYAPTMEWDTGAGQAVVEAAGGKVIRHEDNKRFYYNRENLKNGWFLTEGSK